MSEDVRKLKIRLRREASARRREADAAWRAEAGARIVARILALPEIRQARTVALFASFGHELDTHDLIRQLIAMKREVALPRTVGPGLVFHLVDGFPAGCRPNAAGICEPDPLACPATVEAAFIDLFVVPGLLFDREGYRLGFGGGYFDRALAEAPEARSVAPAFGFQIVDRVPREAHDLPVDTICTENETIAIR